MFLLFSLNIILYEDDWNENDATFMLLIEITHTQFPWVIFQIILNYARRIRNICK